MKRNNSPVRLRTALALLSGFAGMTLGSVNADEPAWGGGHELRMELTSTTFTDNTTLPDSAIYEAPLPNGLNACTPDGAAGGDMSPQLQWSHAPHNTKSFVVVLYDTTAAFTHWGMYNISAHTRQLPQNAGVANSKFGSQVNNDFGDPNYDGPCPPTGVEPDVHDYVFTVYALDTELKVSSSANFPANAETLYHALIRAGREGHILDSASLTGLFSSTPAD
jgi:Raf kinase inhibitor-like YbhB/YbcL family protein